MKSRRAVTLVTAALVVAAAAASACNADGLDVASDGDGGVDAGLVERATCPDKPPRDGAACALPEGTTCDFGRCGTRIAKCTAGAWRFGGNLPPTPPCPATPPESEAGCPPCWPAEITCTYFAERCSDPDAAAGQNIAVASCPAGRWELDITPCRDAGADVQGDGGVEGD